MFSWGSEVKDWLKSGQKEGKEKKIEQWSLRNITDCEIEIVSRKPRLAVKTKRCLKAFYVTSCFYSGTSFYY